MRFPLALSARLSAQKISRTFGGKRAPLIFHFSPLVSHLPPDTRLDSVFPETAWHTPEAGVQAANLAQAPAVWLGGVEPLLHPGIGKVTTALEQSGRYVFLETGGADLRKRIHEFRPDPRFFFAFQISGDEVTGNPTAAERALRTVSETVRMVRLSGFFACAHLVVGAQTSVSEASRLFQALAQSNIDGLLVSSGGGCSGAASTAILNEKLREVRNAIPSRRWRKFSSLLDDSYPRAAPVKEPSHLQAREAGTCGESA